MSYTFSKKNFFLLYFGKWNFLASRLKNYIFSQKKVFLIFRVELCSPKIKKLLYFFKIAFLIFWKIELLEKTSYISEGNFPSSKNYKNLLWKSLFYFGKRMFPASRLKNSYIFSKKKKVLYFRRELAKPGNKHFLYFFKKLAAHFWHFGVNTD